MNATVYVFSKLNGRYSQYPDDYTRELFDKFQSLSGAGAKMVIHRDGELMYYGYIRQLTRKEDYMGFCILLNGVMLTGIEPLAAVFEKAFDEANVFFTVEMAERVSAMIKEAVAEMRSEALPPVAYGISNEETKRFANIGDDEAIVDAAAKYPYVVVEIEAKRAAVREAYARAAVGEERDVVADVKDKNEPKMSEPRIASTEPKEKRPMPKTWLLESILVTVLCCIPFGIAGLVNATKVDMCYVSGEYERAEQLSQQAKKWTMWGFWSTIAVYFLSFVIVVISDAMDS